jgi:hypothetical protein
MKRFRVAVQIDLRKQGAKLQEFWDELISESRREEKAVLMGSSARRLKRESPTD